MVAFWKWIGGRAKNMNAPQSDDWDSYGFGDRIKARFRPAPVEYQEVAFGKTSDLIYRPWPSRPKDMGEDK